MAATHGAHGAQYMRTAFQIPFDATVRVSLDTNLAMIRECKEGDNQGVALGQRWCVARRPASSLLDRLGPAVQTKAVSRRMRRSPRAFGQQPRVVGCAPVCVDRTHCGSLRPECCALAAAARAQRLRRACEQARVRSRCGRFSRAMSVCQRRGRRAQVPRPGAGAEAVGRHALPARRPRGQALAARGHSGAGVGAGAAGERHDERGPQVLQVHSRRLHALPQALPGTPTESRRTALTIPRLHPLSLLFHPYDGANTSFVHSDA